jgi:HSP20 family molecular chaperone IbpA
MKTVALYRPFAMEKAFNDFNRYMDSVLGGTSLSNGPAKGWLPAVDLKEHADSYLLEAELPGMDEKAINIDVEGNILTISSKKEDEPARNVSENYIIQERQSLSFTRSFQLPENADAESISAHFKNGLLCVTIKKRPESKKRAIQIGISHE